MTIAESTSEVLVITLNCKKYKAYPLYMWKAGDLQAAGDKLGVGIKGLPKRIAQSMLEGKNLDYVIRNYEDAYGAVHKHHFMTREVAMQFC